jgi:hypothetical protein
MIPRSRLLLIAVLVVGTLVWPIGVATAGATQTTFTGQEFWVADVPNVGRVSFPDGNFHARGLQSIYTDVASDPRLSGVTTITINYNFRPAPAPVYWTGPMWGTFHTENAAGFWDGTWTGERDEHGFAIIRAVGHGGGAYTGLHEELLSQRLSPDPTAPSTFSGRILEAGGG